MSVAEDVELRDLVSQVLEKNGILAKLRAELRASVFLALEDQSAENKAPFVNNAFKDYLSKAESALGLCLVREFLEYLQLDNTLAVFNTETHHGKDYEYKGRGHLAKDLHLEMYKDTKGPLLSSVIQIVQDSLGSSNSIPHRNEDFQAGDFETNSIPSPKAHLSTNISFTETSSASLDQSHNPFNQTFTTGALITSFGSPEASLDKQPLESGFQTKSKSEASDMKQESKSESHSESSNSDTDPKDTRGFRESKPHFEASEVQNSPTKEKLAHSTNSQTSLSNLPPLPLFKPNKNSGSAQKSLLALMGADDHFEYDFSSGSSGAGDRDLKGISVKCLVESGPQETSSKDQPNSPAHSISEELEGDGNSVTDDPISAASADTFDGSLTHLNSKVADHLN